MAKVELKFGELGGSSDVIETFFIGKLTTGAMLCLVNDTENFTTNQALTKTTNYISISWTGSAQIISAVSSFKAKVIMPDGSMSIQNYSSGDTIMSNINSSLTTGKCAGIFVLG